MGMPVSYIFMVDSLGVDISIGSLGGGIVEDLRIEAGLVVEVAARSRLVGCASYQAGRRPVLFPLAFFPSIVHPT